MAVICVAQFMGEVDGDHRIPDAWDILGERFNLRLLAIDRPALLHLRRHR